MIQNIDWTSIAVAFVSVFCTFLTGILTFLFKTYAKPWLESHNLTALASIAVNAAEAIFGRGNGKKKLQSALDFLNSKGFNINSDEVLAAVEAEWEKLNIAQVAAGIKDASEDGESQSSAE